MKLWWVVAVIAVVIIVAWIAPVVVSLFNMK